MNHVFLIGNLGADPEIRYLPSGLQIAKMRIAVTERWIDRESGQKKEKTHWIGLNAFGRTAEICGRFLKKGSKIAVSGSLEYQEWTDSKDGSKRNKVEVKIQQMEMLGPKLEGGGHGQQATTQSSAASNDAFSGAGFAPDSGDMPVDSMADDDIPF